MNQTIRDWMLGITMAGVLLLTLKGVVRPRMDRSHSERGQVTERVRDAQRGAQRPTRSGDWEGRKKGSKGSAGSGANMPHYPSSSK